MLRLVTAIAIMVMALVAESAPFIISDPWPATSVKPDTCQISYDGSSTFVTWGVVSQSDGSVFCKMDIAALSTGSHTSQVKACNAAGCSTLVPFTFIKAGLPVAPANLRLSP
jgi:hypothetical protein